MLLVSPEHRLRQCPSVPGTLPPSASRNLLQERDPLRRFGDFHVVAGAVVGVAGRSLRRWAEPSSHPRPTEILSEDGPSSSFTGLRAADGPARCALAGVISSQRRVHSMECSIYFLIYLIQNQVQLYSTTSLQMCCIAPPPLILLNVECMRRIYITTVPTV